MANDKEFTSARFIICITFVFISYIFAIFQIYGIFRLRSIRNLFIVQKRYPQIVFLEAILCCIYLLISISFIQQDILEVQFFGSYQSMLMSVTYFTYSYLSHGMVNAEAARLWLIYFDLNYLNSLKNESWKSIINIKQKDQDWFLRKKQTFGNTKWVIFRVSIYYFISATLACIAWNLWGTFHITYIIDSCLYGLPLVLIVYVYVKSPKYSKDYFLFQYEFKVSAYVMMYSIVVYLLAQIVYFYNTFISDLMMVCISLNTSMLSLISTIWIPHKILSKNVWSENNNNYRKRKMSKAETVMNVIHDASPTTTKTNAKDSSNSKLLDLLKNEHDMESFVDHISHEFSCEIMLSFIEFVQYKKYFSAMHNEQYGNVNSSDNDTSPRFENSRSYSYDLNDAIPKSSIVYGVVDIDKPFGNEEHLKAHMKNSAYLLYKKYVCVGSELEINISSSLRNHYSNMMNNYDDWVSNGKTELRELVTLFDLVIDQMFFLMSQSFVRFQYSN